MINVQALLDLINCAESIAVDGCSHGVEWSTFGQELPGEPTDVVLYLAWEDARQHAREVCFTAESLAHARIDGHTITAQDTDGEEISLRLYQWRPLRVMDILNNITPPDPGTTT